MKFGVVVFPGSNFDRDMQYALEQDLGQEVEMLWHKDTELKGFTSEDCIILPGGFSYGDYLRCGAIARFSPMMEAVIRFAGEGGLVIGVCNGFQVLCEAHLLPGVLLRNANQQFLGRNVHIKSNDGAIMKIPIAHGEGRYYADEELLDKLEAGNQVLWKYCDEKGSLNPKTNFNGSTRFIAGICNEGRNVFGLMPHPERATSAALGNTDGRILLEQIFKYRKEAAVRPAKAAMAHS